MSLWVKICGNTSLADAQMAADAGADAVGFVFAPSPRLVTPAEVAAIVPRLPEKLEKIGVFVDLDFEKIAAAVAGCGLTGVQLHGGIDASRGADLAQELRTHFGAGLRILEVIHYGPEAAARLQEAAGNAALDGVLVDSRTTQALGGTGVAYDWQAARAGVFAGESPLRMVAAGGLHPDNVAEAIRTLKPWGVDAVTGVEASPGRKDAEKVRAFVEAARKA
ncbi:MAG TPA: phosphoribosylanthranilate isomerase [Acidobacteriaceae bacterium]|jgi:phosphoribosylanthranilate isomerase|nr:phosphoribosylanthranilate isomerase [Acidobacteriaceae bacterium]